MCRHAIVAHLMDISTGERYIYAAVMLYTLMVRQGWGHGRAGRRADAGAGAWKKARGGQVTRRGRVPAGCLSPAVLTCPSTFAPLLCPQVCHARLVAVVWYDINCKFGR